MCIYMCVYMHVCVHVCKYICKYMYVCNRTGCLKCVICALTHVHTTVIVWLWHKHYIIVRIIVGLLKRSFFRPPNSSISLRHLDFYFTWDSDRWTGGYMFKRLTITVFLSSINSWIYKRYTITLDNRIC